MFVECVVRDVVDVCEKGCVLVNLGWTFGGREGGARGVVIGDGCECSDGSGDRGVRQIGMPGSRFCDDRTAWDGMGEGKLRKRGDEEEMS